MELVPYPKRHAIAWFALLTALHSVLASCSGGVSQEEFDAVEADLQATQRQAQSLEAEKKQLQTRMTGNALEDIGAVLSINELMAFPPTIVELKPHSVSVQMITRVPTTCSIAHGLTAKYGHISTDESMSAGGHTDHFHVLRGLQPDTVHHYKWALLSPNGTFYGSKDFTFTTPPADETQPSDDGGME